ncbi:DUF814 domain-containing protein [archaeon]|nr:DUF814 domain-containing protein [archaeon]
MKITLKYNKSVQENAGIYYDKSKKAKHKLEGAIEALEETNLKLEKLMKGNLKIVQKPMFKKKIKREWFEKFRWFYTSTGFLVIAGRDATTNEIIIKKNTDQNDLVFHTSMAGSPFAVIKSNKKKIDKKAIDETAQFVACYSKAWRMGMSTLEVFSVTPDQVTKEAPSGEYIMKGAFMIYGKKNILDPKLELFIGINEKGRIMSGPKESVQKYCEKFIEITQGQEKTTTIAKKIKSKIGGILDEIVKVIPTGGSKIAR